MALNIPGRVVLFDYGEVISYGQSDEAKAELLTISGAEPEPFWAAYSAHRDALDHGVLSIRDYWKRIAADLGTSWPESRIQQLWVADYTGWLSINPGTFDVISDLHAAGTRVAVLSNAGFDFASPFRFSPMARFFERIFISAELGMLKPYPDIYEEVAEELGVPLGSIIFIDNRQENVDGATALGIVGHLFVGATELRAFLETMTSTGRPPRNKPALTD